MRTSAEIYPISFVSLPEKRKLATATATGGGAILAPEESELLNRKTQCSQKIGDHYGST